MNELNALAQQSESADSLQFRDMERELFAMDPANCAWVYLSKVMQFKV